MRPVDNPRHRFERQYVEWLEEPPSARLEVYEETETRSILARNESPDIPFRWSLNPYRGCTHACAYCYARPSHEYLGYGAGTDFDTKIVAKLRAPELLREQLAKRSWKREMIAFSGDTDCYQPIEASYELTRRCLEACRDAANPVGLITKSFLIARDVELLADLGRRAELSVTFSIPYADDGVARKVEPGAPRPTKRLEAMRILADAGVRVGVLVAPIIPGLSEGEIPRVLELARAAGARHAGHLLLRLPGPVQEVFLGRMAVAFPDRVRRMEARIRETRGGQLTETQFGQRMKGRGAYWEMVDSLFRLHHARLGFDETEREDDETPPPPPPNEQLGLFEKGV